MKGNALGAVIVNAMSGLRQKRPLWAILALALLGLAPLSAQAEQRLALVIGNATYQSDPLKNPVRDAQLMAETLQKAGFVVTRIQNGDLDGMRMGIAKFYDEIKRVGPGATALFYYAGKAVLADGESLLIPVDLDANAGKSLKEQAIGVVSIFAGLKSAGARWKILIIDAGRQVAPGSGGTGRQDLVPVGEEPDSVVAYSTSPGSAASDGDGANSPYTSALTEAILKPGLTLLDLFQEVRISTMDKTGQAQVPWDTITYDFARPFYFIPPQ